MVKTKEEKEAEAAKKKDDAEEKKRLEEEAKAEEEAKQREEEAKDEDTEDVKDTGKPYVSEGCVFNVDPTNDAPQMVKIGKKYYVVDGLNHIKSEHTKEDEAKKALSKL